MNRNNVFRTQAPCVDYAERMSIKPEWDLLALPFILIAADVSEIASHNSCNNNMKEII